ncbi:MAG: SDR family oxidoreductase, partial [Chloroflexi bacterium]|nr:SDR family oxidoreductase [Chloroflexota bacterium]
VTGGGTGMGRAMSQRFAHEGAKVVVNYSRSQHRAAETVDAIHREGGQALSLQADLTSDQEARRMIAETITHYGRLDVLVNNAGWTRSVPPPDLDGLTEEILNQTWAVNVKAPIYCIRAAAPFLRAHRDGAVINITSGAAYTASGSSMIYAASKAALASLTKSLARVLAPEIRVNAIAPGFVDTGFVNWSPETLERLRRPGRLGQAITAEDIADAAIFLACDARATTGQTILVDQGNVALGAYP